MAVTLAQAQVASQNMIQRGVIQTFMDESPILDRIPFMEIEGNAYQYTSESALPGVAFRAVNAAYTESTGVVVNATESLKILGGEADVDTFIQRTLSDLNDQRALQTRLKTRALSLKFNEAFFEGDVAVDVNSFDGLRKRLTGAQVITAGANGAALTLDMLDDLLAAVVGGADVLYAESWIVRKIHRLIRAQNDRPETTRDQYGKIATIYAGIPIIDPGFGADGVTKILAFDETQGTDTSTASVYAVKFGEQEFVSGLTNGGVVVTDLGLLESKPAYRTRIEFFVGMGIFNGKSAARLKGIDQV